jgi:SAM-dependent methyltransferase
MDCPQNSPVNFTASIQILQVYKNPSAADRYAGLYQTPAGRRRHFREEGCIAKGLAGVPKGSRVLDLPCGAGRMYPLLKRLGYQVTEADGSPSMLEYARRNAEKFPHNHTDEFVIADAFHTPFEDGQFDAVVCNRLIHHFPEPQVRQQLLRELGRISRGPIVISFFSLLATDAVKYTFKHAVSRFDWPSRKPISPWQFAHDVRRAGLTIARWIVPLPGFSMQWYAVLKQPR